MRSTFTVTIFIALSATVWCAQTQSTPPTTVKTPPPARPAIPVRPAPAPARPAVSPRANPTPAPARTPPAPARPSPVRPAITPRANPAPAPSRPAPAPVYAGRPAPTPRTNPAVATPSHAPTVLTAPATVRMPSGSVVEPHKIFSRTVRNTSYHPNVILPHVFSTPPTAIPVSVQMERIGPAPRAGLIFIPGYYFWNEGPQEGFVWIDPVWAVPPVVGAVWIDPNWTYDGHDQWALQEGYWQEPAMPETQDDGPCAGHYIHPGCPSADTQTPTILDTMDQAQQNAPAPPPPPVVSQEQTLKSVPIANGQIVMQGLNFMSYRFHIGPESEVHIVGDFSTTNPSGVQATINDGKQKGRKGTLTFWSAPASTYNTLDVRLNPGDYFLDFFNPSLDPISVNVNVSLSIRP